MRNTSKYKTDHISQKTTISKPFQEIHQGRNVANKQLVDILFWGQLSAAEMLGAKVQIKDHFMLIGGIPPTPTRLISQEHYVEIIWNNQISWMESPSLEMSKSFIQ